MERLPVTDFSLGIALHTMGYPLRTKVWRDEAGTPARLSGWIDHKVRDCAKLITDQERGKLARENPHHPLLASLAGVQCLQALETWLKHPDTPPAQWPVLPVLSAQSSVPGEQSTAHRALSTVPFPLRTTDDLATAAALIVTGFLPRGASHFHNAGDGTHAALHFLPQSRTFPGLTREIADTLTGPLSQHPLAYATFAARNWMRFQIKCDPSAAREFTALIKGVGTRCAVVSRKLIDSTAPYIELRLPNGTSRRFKNRFRDQMRHHLRGFAASEIN